MKNIHISSKSAASNVCLERFHGSLSNALKVSVTAEKDCVRMLPFTELSFRSSPVRGLRISLCEIRNAKYSMALSIYMMMLNKFDEEHHSPPEYIMNLRNNIDRLNYITLQNKNENQILMKKTYDNKVIPYRFYQGQKCYLFDQAAKVGERFKIRRKWNGSFVISKISSHNINLYSPASNKYIGSWSILTGSNRVFNTMKRRKTTKISRIYRLWKSRIHP